MNGHIAYCCDERSEHEGWHLLAIAIINRTLRDAQLQPEQYKTSSLRRRAEQQKADAIDWISAVDPSVIPAITPATQHRNCRNNSRSYGFGD